jgi:hypothetical protein
MKLSCPQFYERKWVKTEEVVLLQRGNVQNDRFTGCLQRDRMTNMQLVAATAESPPLTRDSFTQQTRNNCNKKGEDEQTAVSKRTVQRKWNMM